MKDEGGSRFVMIDHSMAEQSHGKTAHYLPGPSSHIHIPGCQIEILQTGTFLVLGQKPLVLERIEILEALIW